MHRIQFSKSTLLSRHTKPVPSIFSIPAVWLLLPAEAATEHLVNRSCSIALGFGDVNLQKGGLFALPFRD